MSYSSYSSHPSPVFLLFSSHFVLSFLSFPKFVLLLLHTHVCVCIYIYIYTYIHTYTYVCISLLSSFHSLSYDNSIASSNANSQQSAIYCFNFQFQCPLVSLKPSSSCLRHHPLPLATSILPFIFPSTVCFRRQIIQKMCSVQLSCLFFYYMFDIPLLLDCV